MHLCGPGVRANVSPSTSTTKTARNRRENITDWALKHFREHYRNKKITKWDIFHYVYGVLHHPGYRERFAENLKRELPRIPLAPPTSGLSPWPARSWPGCTWTMKSWSRGRWTGSKRPACRSRTTSRRCGWRKTKPSLKVNDSLTLAGIPPEVFQYRLGNRMRWNGSSTNTK